MQGGGTPPVSWRIRSAPGRDPFLEAAIRTLPAILPPA